MDILQQIAIDMGLAYGLGNEEETERKRAPMITGWRFRTGRKPELVRVESSAEGFARSLRCDEVEDFALGYGLSVICDADNWWSDKAYTFCVDDMLIRGPVLVVGSDENGFVSIPKEAFNLNTVLAMCSAEPCCV